MADNRSVFHPLGTAEQVAEEAAQRILSASESAIAERGRFQLVLAGGRTPLTTYTLLAERQADWDRWHIFFGDERCLGVDDPDRNSVAAERAFLHRVPIPESNVHRIPAELGAEQAAEDYEAIIVPRLPFDLVVLGMGEDGHTASLFPGRAIAEERYVMPVHAAPKPPPDRVTLTPLALTATASILIVVTGAGKREALARWRQGADLPVAEVARHGAAVLVDADAAGAG